MGAQEVINDKDKHEIEMYTHMEGLETVCEGQGDIKGVQFIQFTEGDYGDRHGHIDNLVGKFSCSICEYAVFYPPVYNGNCGELDIMMSRKAKLTEETNIIFYDDSKLHCKHVQKMMGRYTKYKFLSNDYLEGIRYSINNRIKV
jgi:hypothetical protein